MKNVLLSSIALCLLSGCCSIVSKSSSPVTISTGKAGDRVMIYNREGVAIQNGQAPMTVTLATSSGYFRSAKYRVEVSRPGCVPQNGMISANLNPWYFGNILFGGLIGMVIVDPATGAMWKLPDSYALPSPCKAATVQNGRVKVAMITDIPADLRAKLVRVN